MTDLAVDGKLEKGKTGRQKAELRRLFGKMDEPGSKVTLVDPTILSLCRSLGYSAQEAYDLHQLFFVSLCARVGPQKNGL